ncbi:MAG: DUF5615 family PIN-like protein [Bdellovibrionales bacterium]|nr:DUF5615 family PIN-like protein [Bdellovibrionales bacterium]
MANENFPLAPVELLRQAGHDVIAIGEDSPGISDREVLKRAALEKRIVVTFDSDYGELVFFEGYESPPAILLLRFAPNSPKEPAERISALVSADESIVNGFFVVLDRDSVRRRPLPRDEA